ncbi:MAG: SDR family oxidoreductase [Deltaproteobacteria bacterium]|nr:SDR family oxidoreductase [Deltaproteobacteria bacterium]
MNTFSGKIALVTGASRGIGRGCAVALSEGGADIAVNYRSREDAARETCSLIESLGRRAIPIQADVSVASDVGRMIKTIERELGPVGILVNNAGIARHHPLDEIREEDWDEIIAVNLKSAFLVTQAVLPGMRTRRWGRIINISSGAAQIGGVVGPHYAASKAGILGLTHGYASLLIKEGITANAVAPSLIETEMVTHDLQVNPNILPLGRFGTVEEVADVVLTLARNAYITGQTIYVNGGRYMS